jgi:hypothetical protein
MTPIATIPGAYGIWHMAYRLWPEAAFLIGQCQICTPELSTISHMLYAIYARAAGVGLRARAHAMLRMPFAAHVA